MRRLLPLLVTLVVLAPSPAAATDVTAEELARLAGRARSDTGALTEIRRVTSVDGTPVDVSSALEGAEGERLSSRLNALTEQGEGTSPRAAGQARREAQRVLAQARYREQEVPRPFAGLFALLGRLLEPVGDAFAAAFRFLARLLPGGDSSVWAVLGVLVVVGAAVVSLRLGRRRAQASAQATAQSHLRSLDERSLERAAAAAALAGDHSKAVRLRFLAGLLRLDKADAITWRPSLITSEVEASICSAEFESLARSFDEIVYGGRAAMPEDSERARAGWQRVLQDVSPP
ncbi:MAG: hypothetical protein M3454_15860 [Actinomycetota bacterium]|nr:hypothetical protein [Actinomycetota bacterium]